MATAALAMTILGKPKEGAVVEASLPQNASVLSAQPVGVWRTYQTHDDYVACLKHPVADPAPGAC